MNDLLPWINSDLDELAGRVRKSLVMVTVGRRGSGSGVVYSDDGLVVTNAHVVSNKRHRREAGDLKVTLPGGQIMAAKVLAEDDGLDVALLKLGSTNGSLPEVDLPKLQAIQMGDSKALRAGQWVMAMGHPGGVPGVAAAGIVIGAGPDLPEAQGDGRDWIAVDLALRPGHSGGPLVDHQGRLIGISTIMAGLEVGMAVPAHVIGNFVEKVLAGETEAS